MCEYEWAWNSSWERGRHEMNVEKINTFAWKPKCQFQNHQHKKMNSGNAFTCLVFWQLFSWLKFSISTVRVQTEMFNHRTTHMTKTAVPVVFPLWEKQNCHFTSSFESAAAININKNYTRQRKMTTKKYHWKLFRAELYDFVCSYHSSFKIFLHLSDSAEYTLVYF